jgi:DNA-binding response OmpR family regulator
MLTALGELHHKLQGFDAGADDYLAKPFEPAELVARVKSLLKRSAPSEAPSAAERILQVGALVLEVADLVVVAGGIRHNLPSKEFEILACLARAPGRLFSREQLLAAAWGPSYTGADRTVDVYVNRIRTRFPEAEYSYRITPVRGVGYRLEVES